MTIATKNGAIIVKDGKFAENCGCCGGWYCSGGDQSCVCPTESISGITVSITATDFLLHAQYRDISNTPNYGSYLHMISRLNGTHALAPLSSEKDFWAKSFSPIRTNQGGCVLCQSNGQDIRVSFSPIFNNRITVTLCSYWSSIVTTGSDSGLQYFDEGDTIRVGDRTYTFGQYDSVSENNVGNPDRLRNVRIAPSAAFCWSLVSQCVNGQRQWSPPMASTMVASESYGGVLAWIPISTADSVTGQDSLTVNSVTISY